MRDFLIHKFPDKPELLEILDGYLQFTSYRKNEVIVQSDKVCDRLFFLHKGVVMQRYVEGTIEKAIGFNFENEFFSSIESFFLSAPSDVYLECLEDCEVSYITKAQFDEFMLKKHEIYKIAYEYVVEEMYLRQLQTTSRLLAYSVEKMYAFLLKERPEIIQRVPLKYVAEYMGISKEYLSRLRRKLAEEDRNKLK